MRFRIGADMYLEPDIQDEQINLSPSTGRSLRRLVIHFQGRGNAFRDAAERLRQIAQEDGIRTVDSSDVPEPEWRLHNAVSGYSGQEGTATIHWCQWVLEEKENLRPDPLEVAGVSLHPDQYEEEFTDDRLRVMARVVLGSDDVDSLRHQFYGSETVTVVRRGIQDAPREMVLTNLLWSANDSGTKIHLDLSDPIGARLDSRDLFAIRDTRFWRLTTLARETSTGLERLAESLVKRGIITEEDRQNVVPANDGGDAGRWWNLFWVADLDQWKF